MPDEAGKIGYGSTVRVCRGDPSEPTNWTELELVGDLELPDEQTDEVEMTHQKSPGRRKQFGPGLTDGGSVGVPVNYIPGNDTDVLLKDLRKTREQVLVEITPSEDGTPETYSSYLSGYARTAPIGDKMTATATFRVSEEVVQP